MRTIREIPVRDILVDRFPMNRDTYDLAKYLDSGGVVSPIHVAINQNGRFMIKDGRHRVLAYRLLGKNKINARFSVRRIKNDII